MTYDDYWDNQFKVEPSTQLTAEQIKQWSDWYNEVQFREEMQKIGKRLAEKAGFEIATYAPYNMYWERFQKSASTVPIDDHGLIWSGSRVYINTYGAALQSMDSALLGNRMVVKERWGTYWNYWATGSKFPE